LNLFSTSFLAKHKVKLLFILVWLHISILDLFYLTYRGPVFLWQENGQFKTLLVHLFIALATVGCYLATEKLTAKYSIKKS